MTARGEEGSKTVPIAAYLGGKHPKIGGELIL